jgi:1-acyl-sn-glycerol-3-phosphate acyltransferase
MPSKTKINRLYWFCHDLISMYMFSLGRLKITGMENIPPENGLILASNHVAGADPFLLGSAAPREMWFMAKKELFEVPVQGWFISHVNAFPVDRFGFDLEVIKKSITLLQEGKALIMFPEGTRSKTGEVREGKIGVGMLARKAGAPIVPVYMENTRKAWFNFLKGKRMYIRFGPVVDSEWIKSLPNGKDGYRQITELVMQRINDLKNNREDL